MHRGERRAFAVLLVACLLAAGWITYEQWWRPLHPQPMAGAEVAWLALEEEQRADSVHTFTARSQRVPHLFAFDPNTLALAQWQDLGLSPRQAAAVQRFQAHGGRFRTKRDVARMRVVDPALFAQWEPFIQLPDSLPARSPAGTGLADAAVGTAHTATFERAAPAQVEVNTADTLRLQEVNGIGPAFARGIVKYRDRLGGFYSLEQLNEVYVLRDKPDAVVRLKERLLLDPRMVRRFPVNSVTAEELGPHPYAGWKVAKALVAYRKQHGPFHALEDIKGCALVTDSVYHRLVPYLIME